MLNKSYHLPVSVAEMRKVLNEVEYVVSEASAIVCGWRPEDAESCRVELPEQVTIDGRSYPVELLVNECFAKQTLQVIVVPKSVKTLPRKCCEWCTRLEEVLFEAESCLAKIGQCCFKRCMVSQISIPDSVLRIGKKCFDQCHKLHTVEISEKSRLLRIGKCAFRGCHLTDLFLPDGLEIAPFCMPLFLGVDSFRIGSNRSCLVTQDSVMSQNGKSLFHVFSSGDVYEVPDFVKWIAPSCFAKCPVRKLVFGSKTRIKARDLVVSLQGSNIDDVVFLDTSRQLFVENRCLFYRVDEFPHKVLLSILMGQQWNMIRPDILKLARCVHPDVLRSIDFSENKDKVMVAVDLLNVGCAKRIPRKCFMKCENITQLSFLASTCIQIFSRKAFCLSGLCRLNVPKSVTHIEYKCFFGCPLREVTFESESSLKEIGSKAFMNTAISHLVVPPSVEQFVGTSFSGIPDISFPKSKFFEVEDGLVISTESHAMVLALKSAGDNGDLMIPKRVRSLAAFCFYRRGYINAVKFGVDSKLEMIDKDAFKYCHVDVLFLPRRLYYLGIQNSGSIKQVVLEEGNKYLIRLNDEPLLNLIMKKSCVLTCVTEPRCVFNIPEYIRTIRGGCFNALRQPYVVSFCPGECCELHELEASVFERSNLMMMKCPSSPLALGERCFSRCHALRVVTFPLQCTIEQLGEWCFSKCALSSITVPASVKTLPEACFLGCHLLEIVDFEQNSQLTRLDDMCFSHCVSLRDIKFPQGLRKVLMGALCETCIADLCLPPCVDELGGACLLRYHGISVTLDCLIDSIPQRFLSESWIKSISIPSTVVNIEKKAFLGCLNLETVLFETDSALQLIDDKAFKATGIISIMLPQSINTLGIEVFAQCRHLKQFMFAEGARIQKITGQNVFDGTRGCAIHIPLMALEVVRFTSQTVSGALWEVSSQMDALFIFQKTTNTLLQTNILCIVAIERN